MVAFIAGLRKNKNKDLIRSLYLTPPEDFDSTMRKAKDHMLAEEALDSSNNEEQDLPQKQQKGLGEKSQSTSDFRHGDHLPHPLDATS